MKTLEAPVLAHSAPAALEVAFLQTKFGLALIATADQAVKAIFLGDDEASLREALQQRYPKAQIEGQPQPALLQQIKTALNSPAQAHDLPLSPSGTEFQQQVWAALRRIPAGKPSSYAQIAAQLGKPTAVRAVGSACGANPIAILIPCHRVLSTQGQLSGYRWGVDRKQALLAHEQKGN